MLTSGLSKSAPVGGFKFSTCQQIARLKQEKNGKVKAQRGEVRGMRPCMIRVCEAACYLLA